MQSIIGTMYKKIQNETSTIEQWEKPTIKQRLLARFDKAISLLGDDWRKQLVAYNPYFNTKDGVYDYQAVSAAVSNPRRANADRIEKVVEALEAVIESKKTEI